MLGLKLAEYHVAAEGIGNVYGRLVRPCRLNERCWVDWDHLIHQNLPSCRISLSQNIDKNALKYLHTMIEKHGGLPSICASIPPKTFAGSRTSARHLIVRPQSHAAKVKFLSRQIEHIAFLFTIPYNTNPHGIQLLINPTTPNDSKCSSSSLSSSAT